MLVALVACLALAPAAHGGHVCAVCKPEGRVGEIVAMAWQEAEAKSQEPLPKPEAEALAAQARHKRDVQNDIELGRKYSAEVDKELKPSEDVKNLERIRRIGAELAEIANSTPVDVSWGDKRLSVFPYEFRLVQGKDVNAFSLPGGVIYIYDGLVAYAESDHELAGVIAHEISHAAFRHVATLQREQNKISMIQLPLIVAAIMTGSRAAADAMAVGNLIGTAQMSGWSLNAELSADYGGFQYMKRSKYDPAGLITFMERLARDDRMRPQIDWGIFRTHPPSKERAEALTRYMRAAGLPVRRSRVSSSMRADVVPGDNGSVDVVFGGRQMVGFAGSDAIGRADRAVEALNEFFDSEPELFEATVTEDGEVLGRRRLLFVVNEADAAAAGKTAEEYRVQVLRNLRGALFSMAFRVWDM